MLCHRSGLDRMGFESTSADAPRGGRAGYGFSRATKDRCTPISRTDQIFLLDAEHPIVTYPRVCGDPTRCWMK